MVYLHVLCDWLERSETYTISGFRKQQDKIPLDPSQWPKQINLNSQAHACQGGSRNFTDTGAVANFFFSKCFNIVFREVMVRIEFWYGVWMSYHIKEKIHIGIV